MAQVASRIVVSTADDRIRSSDAAQRGLLRIDRGVFLPQEVFDQWDDRWQAREAIALARAWAVARRGRGVSMIGPTAALIHGLHRVPGPEPVHVHHAYRQHAVRQELPAVRFPNGWLIEPAPVVHHTGALGADTLTDVAGVTTQTLPAAVISSACLLPEDPGFVILCDGLSRLTGFDRERPEQSRQSEAAARQMLHRELERLPAGSRGLARAVRALARADAGCESVGERRLLRILRGAGIPGTVTQVRASNGRMKRYIDIALPGIRLAIEFDGKDKYGRDRRTILQSLSDRDARDKFLESLGWTVLHFEWSELDHPKRIVAEVRRHIAQLTAAA